MHLLKGLRVYQNQHDVETIQKTICQEKTQQLNSATFRSKVPRLAPAFALQGLASEVTPTSIENPGPGSYTHTNLDISTNPKSKLEILQSLIRKQQEANHQKRLMILEAMQSDGKPLQKQKSTIPTKKPPKDGFTGLDSDRPGPEMYNPSINLVKSKSTACLFSKSNAKRDFLMTAKCQIETPGLYAYQNSQEGILIKREQNKTGMTSTFLSKVPNCQDMKQQKQAAQMPGPGAYFNDNLSSKSSQSDKKIMKPGTPRKSPKLIKDAQIVPGPADYFKPDHSQQLKKKLYGLVKSRSLSRNKQHHPVSQTPQEFNFQLNQQAETQIDCPSITVDQWQDSSSRASSNMFFAKIKKPIYHLRETQPQHTNFGLGNVEALLRKDHIDRQRAYIISRQKLLRQSKSSQHLRSSQKQHQVLVEPEEEVRIDSFFDELNAINDLHQQNQPQHIFKSALDRFGNNTIQLAKLNLSSIPGPGSYIKDDNQKVNQHIYSRLFKNSGSRTSHINKRTSKDDLISEEGPSTYNINNSMIKRTYNVALASDRFHQ